MLKKSPNRKDEVSVLLTSHKVDSKTKSEVKRGQKWVYDRMLFFTKKEYADRRKAFWQNWNKQAPVMILGREESHYEHFQQWSNMEYFTGFREPGATLFFIPTSTGCESHLFIQPVREETTRWEGIRWDPSQPQCQKHLGVDFVHSSMEMERFVSQHVNGKTLGTFFHRDRQGAILMDHPQSKAAMTFINKYNLQYENCVDAIADTRRSKSSAEIKFHTMADEITGASIKDVLKQWRHYRNEREIQADIEAGFMRRGSESVAYEPIVGAGVNSTVLHYRNNDFGLAAGQVVLMDVGARYHGYCADITRCFPRARQFTKRQKEIYELVLKAQLQAISKVRAGVTWDELNDAAWGVIKQAGFERWHGVGHYLGMDVHDVGDTKKPINANAVITIEPGVYIPEEGIGIRIEDDVLVTKTGPKVLSAMIPKKLDDIERLLKN